MVDYYVEDILIPLKDIIIPPDYLLPDFKNHGEEKRKIEDIDIFQFGTRNIEKKVRDGIKAHIRDCPETIAPCESSRSANGYFLASD